MKQIQTITLYGVGLLGASLGAGFKSGGFTGTIRGVSRQESLDEALAIDAIDQGFTYDNAQEALRDTDLLIICSPIQAIIKTLTTISKLDLPEGMLISDVGSTKTEILATAESVLPKSVQFIGGHPMAGSEQSGPSAADPFLFQNAVYVLSPSKLSNAETLQSFATFLESHLGCRPLELTPDTHDMISATVSHVPHLLAVAMVNMAQEIDNEIPGTLELAAGGFKSLTRIASSPYKMWHDIYETNKPATKKILGALKKTLDSLDTALDSDSLKEPFEQAATTRTSLSTNRKGFLGPLFEIVVMAEDKPGFLARMTALLFEEEINIKDLELLKVREGEGGSFMLAFGSEEEAQKACARLNVNNFSARIR